MEMTREEAINHIKYALIENNYPLPKELGIEALNMAIKALEQEPCEDAVSRKALIEHNNIIDIRQAVMQTPSVTPTSSIWIPVSKRLPEEETRVIICTVDGEIDIADHRLQDWTNDDWEWFVCGTLGYKRTYCDNEVVAWMQLPEPYEAENGSEE